MKKKNEREQELDEKEFENELDRALSSEYREIESRERLYEGTNPWIIGALNFFSTLVFFEIAYWVGHVFFNTVTFGYTRSYFEVLGPVVHMGILALSIHAVIRKKSYVEWVVDKWPFV